LIAVIESVKIVQHRSGLKIEREFADEDWVFLKGARRGADPGREANRDDAGEDVLVEGDKTERNDTVYSVIEIGNILPFRHSARA
jgi:hypothetical protein